MPNEASTAALRASATSFQRLIEIGIALSAERDNKRLMETILLGAKDITNADGGTLYLRTEGDRLKFEIMRTDSLNIAMGGTTGKEITLPPLEMRDEKTGEPNHKNIACHAALTGRSVNIPDAYETKEFDFAGTREFDRKMAYRSMSFLTVPMKNRQQRVIGVLQILNARDRENGAVIPFSAEVQPLVEALASQAAVALDNAELVLAQKRLFERLIQIGVALSAERDNKHLMERILLEAKDITNADGGTLYLRTEDDRLKFEIMRTDSLNIAMGGTTGKEISFPPLRMRDEKTGEPNHRNISTHAALTGRSVNIADAYETKEFDFSGTRKFDQGTGYRSKSFLTVPMKNSQEQVIGVLQLLNARDRESGAVIPFGAEVQPLVEALASQAAVALDNAQLLLAQKRLLEAFIELIAAAIDAKSPYTGGHCQRVPELTKMLVRAACDSKDEPFREFNLSEEEWYELHIGAWLHDCGKVTTPEYVVDKATKLETIYDRIHEVRTRFEVVKRDAVIDYLKAVIAGGDPEDLKAKLEERLAKLDDDFAFVAESNLGGEFMAPEKVARVKEIAKIKWMRTLDDRIGVSFDEQKRKARTPKPELPVEEHLLMDREDHIMYRESGEGTSADDKYGFKLDVPQHKFNLGEVYNLCIARGTLTAEERFKINDHIVQTIIMLETLPFPKHLKRVPEYAGGHHEKMDGTGYPRKLKRNEMSVPARCMAIADIFEALTAADRPYKPAKKLSESIKIMSFMCKDAHIDRELFELFLRSGVYKQYADRFLKPEQIDEVDIGKFLPAAAPAANAPANPPPKK